MIALTTYQNIPLLGFAAFSGTGKTTLLEQLIPELNQANIRVAMVKHTHHEKFDIDKPGKDSYRLRKAGAEQMLVASAKRWALMVEQPPQETMGDPDLFTLLAHLDLSKTDLILVELYRPALNKPLLYPDDSNIIAIATDHKNLADEHPDSLHCPLLDINNISQITTFISNLLQDLQYYEPQNEQKNKSKR